MMIRTPRESIKMSSGISPNKPTLRAEHRNVVISRDKNRRKTGTNNSLCQLWEAFEAMMGKTMSPTALLRPSASAVRETPTCGRPTPIAPLSAPPKKRTRMQ
jgi:hypothetical protein